MPTPDTLDVSGWSFSLFKEIVRFLVLQTNRNTSTPKTIESFRANKAFLHSSTVLRVGWEFFREQLLTVVINTVKTSSCSLDIFRTFIRDDVFLAAIEYDLLPPPPQKKITPKHAPRSLLGKLWQMTYS